MTRQTGLSIVEPIALTDAMLIATDVPETDYTAYSAGTTYAKDAYTMVVATHKVYQSLQAANIGRDPATSPTWWIEVGFDNRWKMFDGKIGTSTAKASSFYYRIALGVPITSVAFLNIKNAYTIRVRLIDPTYGTVFDVTSDVSAAPRSSDWWEWTYGIWSSGKSKLVLLEVPPFASAELRIDVTGSADLSIGACLFGQSVNFGQGVTYGVRVGTKDYSQKTRDTWGNLDIVQGAYTDRNSFDLFMANSDIDPLKDYLDSIRSKKCLFIVSDLYTSTVVYGIYSIFEIVIAYATHSNCSFDLEGLT